MPTTRTKLAPGVWRDPYGISVIVHTSAGYTEERHPLGTELGKLKRRREALRAVERDRAAVVKARLPGARLTGKRTFASDAEVYLKARAAMPTIRDRTRHMNDWVALFGQRPRAKIAPHEIAAQRDAWLLAGKSPAWVNLHLRALSNFYRTLDEHAPNPVSLKKLKVDEPEAIPRGIPWELVEALFDSMPESNSKCHLRVIATTGIEQASFARLTAADVDLTAATVYLARRKKGQGVAAQLLPLTPFGVDAFKTIAREQLWGPYNTPSVYKAWKAACRRVEKAHNKKHPEAPISLSNLRPKDLRHTFGTEMSKATGGNVSIVQMFLQQSTPGMAERYRAAAVPQHLRDAAAALGLLGGSVGRVKKVKK